MSTLAPAPPGSLPSSSGSGCSQWQSDSSGDEPSVGTRRSEDERSERLENEVGQPRLGLLQGAGRPRPPIPGQFRAATHQFGGGSVHRLGGGLTRFPAHGSLGRLEPSGAVDRDGYAHRSCRSVRISHRTKYEEADGGRRAGRLRLRAGPTRRPPAAGQHSQLPAVEPDRRGGGGGGWVVSGFADLPVRGGAVRSVAFLAAAALGVVVMYCMWLILSTLTFRIVKGDEIIDLFQGVYQAGRWPVSIYPN